MTRLHRFIHRNRRAEEGAAFLSALMAVGVLALLAAATLSLSSAATRSAAHWNDRADALHAAESGLNEALWRLDQGESPTWGAHPDGPVWLDRTGAQSPLSDGAEYRVWAEDLGGGEVRVTARGTRENSTRVVSVRLRRAGGAGPDDGRYVAFASDATNLVTGDSNGVRDAFLREWNTPLTERVPVIAALVQGDGASINPAVSGDGRYVAFESKASNLVAGDTNGKSDVFRRDRVTGEILRVSVATGGAEGNQDSTNPSVSADGRYVAFVSKAAFGTACSNGKKHVFVRDVTAGTTTCVSVGTGGAAGNADSANPAVSGDGRYVAFESNASNLVAGDTNGKSDVFRHDLQTGATVRVSLGSGGAQANQDSKNPSISDDGRYVAFESKASLADPCTNGKSHVFVRDTQGAGSTACASRDAAGTQGNKDSKNPSLTGDGRYVAFESDASNLVAGDTNGKTDVFRRDLQTGATVRVSLDAAGAQINKDAKNPTLSDDGRYVAFESKASLAAPCTNGKSHVFVRDTQGAGSTTCASRDTAGTQGDKDSKNPSLSGDGRHVAFESDASNLVAGDTNGKTDVFLRDLQTPATERVSVAQGAGANPDDRSDNPVPSGDGRYVAFESDASNLVAGDTNGSTDIFRYDRVTGETILVSVATGGAQGNADSTAPSISADGRYIAFVSKAALGTPCSNGKKHIFVRDLQNGTTTCASAAGETAGNSDSKNPRMSADGRYVAFESGATNLVAGDTNGRTDIFRRDVQTGAIDRVSLKGGTTQATANSQNPAISADGRYVAFESAGGLDAGPGALCTNTGRIYIWLRDTQAGVTACVSLKDDGTAAGNDSAAPAISGDGRYVAFESRGGLDTGPGALCTVPGRTYIWLRDTQAGSTTCVSLKDDGTSAAADSAAPSISAGGRYVAFESRGGLDTVCTNTGRTYIWLRDTQAGSTTCVSVSTAGAAANGDSQSPAINADAVTGASVVDGSWSES